MNKKLCLLFILISFFITSKAIAQIPLNDLLGQDHYYSVTFSGNGEAIVTMKVALSNITEATISSILLSIPRVAPKDISVYQAIREPVCIRYKEITPSVLPPDKILSFPIPSPDQLICEEYQTPNYYQYGNENNVYKKAEYQLNGDKINILLPDGIKLNSSGGYIIYYRAFGYTKKNLTGAFNYIFETLKVDDKIRSLQIAINTDSNLILRDPQAVKNISNLQPLDSYTIKGSYADSNLKLYAKEITIVMAIIIGLLLLIIYVAKFIFRKIKQQNKQISINAFYIIFSIVFTITLVMIVYLIYNLIFILFRNNQSLPPDSILNQINSSRSQITK